MKPTLLLTDSGRNLSHSQERLDCAVRASCNFFQISYITSHEIFKKYGRRDQSVTTNCIFKKVTKLMSRKFRKPMVQVKQSGSINKLVSLYHNAVILVSISDHVFTIIKGIQFDMSKNSGNQHIKGAWLLREEVTQ